MSFNTPVLFLVFNRPAVTQQVFDAIREAKPKQLFIAADGPRENNIKDIENCKAVKAVVANIDWDCELKTLYRVENLGCGLSVSSAISWFFEHVEQGIILEDDCLPSASFFPFCQEMLELYKNDTRIHSIGGTNFFERWNRGDDSYFFSKESGIWGWATWKRSWKEYDYYVSKWQYPEVVALFKSQFENSIQKDIFVHIFEQFFNTKEAHTWDFQFVFSRFINSQFGIIPSVNLITNIGFGNQATHTTKEDALFSNLRSYEISFPLIHPKAIIIDKEYDSLKVSNEYLVNSSRITKIKTIIFNNLYKIVKKIRLDIFYKRLKN